GPDQVEGPRDDPVGRTAEVGREQGEDDRYDGADRCRSEPDDERVTAAVQKSSSHVAAELVGAQEIRAAGCAPLRTDRDAARRQLNLAIAGESRASRRDDMDRPAVLVDDAAGVREGRAEM